MRRLGGYNLFWRMHANWKPVYLLLLLHGPIRLWIWLFFPAILIVLDRIMLANRKSMYVKLKKVKLLPRDVIGLTFQAPRGFVYQAGQYILLGWRGEWHPFTLTSAPEERFISVHIRASDSLDWCSALDGAWLMRLLQLLRPVLQTARLNTKKQARALRLNTQGLFCMTWYIANHQDHT